MPRYPCLDADKSQAVLFAYDVHTRYKEVVQNVRLQGLDPTAQYLVEEINLMPDTKSRHRAEETVKTAKGLAMLQSPFVIDDKLYDQ